MESRKPVHLIFILIVSWLIFTGCLSCQGRDMKSVSSSIGLSSTPTSIQSKTTHPQQTQTSPPIETVSIPGTYLKQTVQIRNETITPYTALTATTHEPFTTQSQTPMKSSSSPRVLSSTATQMQIETAPQGWLVFASYGRTPYGIDIIHTSGKGWRRIADLDFPQFPSWSPDGQWIAVNSSMAIFLIRPDGSEIIQLTHSSEATFQCCPSWSPDSNVVVYSQTTEHTDHTSVDLYKINLNTRLVSQLTNTPGIQNFLQTGHRVGGKLHIYQLAKIIILSPK